LLVSTEGAFILQSKEKAMENARILWVDDEIDSLKPHCLFLEARGMVVTTSNNAADALQRVLDERFDAVLLDEHMPGGGGLELLPKIKAARPSLPVVMITKSEEDGVMQEAIGSQISDYLLKPVHPRQVLTSLTKLLSGDKLAAAQTETQYQQTFRELSVQVNDARSWENWTGVHRALCHWEMALEKTGNEAFSQLLQTQRDEANALFAKFVERNYLDWMADEAGAPLQAHRFLKRILFPALTQGQRVLLLVLDNLRWDQWKVLQPLLEAEGHVREEGFHASLLPTATQYARNALFAGMTPLGISKRFPEYWVEDRAETESGRNNFEEALLGAQLQTHGLGQIDWAYAKLTHAGSERKFAGQWPNLKKKQLVALVVNFIDMLSHAKAEQSIVRDLASDDAGYRALTKTWWERSPLREVVDQALANGMEVLVTTDHGTVLVKEPVKLTGERDLTTNLRFKQGRGVQVNPKEAVVFDTPEKMGLPNRALGEKVYFARGSDFFAYPNQYNYYVQHFRNTYQHGGVSLEEMAVPYAWLTRKS
jgi:DNA-binding response OmpR family regulator